MNTDYQLTLSDNKYWIKTPRPVKLIHLRLSPRDNRFKVQRIYIYLGDPSIKKILNNPTKLKKRFGPDWEDILAMNIKGGQLIDIGEEKKKTVKKVEAKEKDIVQYIYDYSIFMDDSIENIKTKIELETGVSSVNQHIFWKTKNGYCPFDYYIKYLTRLDQEYPINILDLFKNQDNKKMVGIPIDTKLIKEYKSRNVNVHSFLYYTYYSVIYKRFSYNHRNYELKDHKLPFTLYLVDLGTINNFIDRTEYDRLNMAQYSRFYDGFLLKYWPGVSNKTKKIFITKPSSNLTVLKNTFMVEEKTKSWIADVTCQDVIKYFKPTLIILMMQIKANYELAYYLNKELVDIRILYEYLDPGEFITDISYGNRIKRKDCPEKEKPEDARIELNTIKFRLNLGKDKTPLQFELNKSGRITIGAYGKKEYKTTFKSFIKLILDTSNKLINKINSLGSIVMVGGFQLPILNSYNIKLKFMNIHVHLGLVKDTVKERDLVYVDPIKFPALIDTMFNYFVPDKFKFNEPVDGIIHSLTVHFNRIPERKELASRNISNQMNPNIKIIDEHDIRSQFIHEGSIFKIIMGGIRDMAVFHHAYNFLARLIYLYHEFNAGRIKDDPIIKKMLTVGEQKFMKEHKQYLKYSIPYSKIKRKDIVTSDNVYEYLNQGKSFKEIKLLKETDNILFNYDHLYKTKSGRKLKPYSKVCQAGMQPIPMSDQALKKWNKYKKGETPILRYSNKTRPSEGDINYVCPYNVYKYPGFQRYDRHPKGYCLPCCRKKNFLENPDSMAFRRYAECVKTGQIPTKLERRRALNKKYIKHYGKIGPGRYSWLPDQLMKIFNESWVYNDEEEFINKCPYKKIRLLDTETSSCVLLRGIQQSYRSYVTAIESALDLGQNTLLDLLIDSLKKNPKIFSSLEMGMIKTRFESLNNYLNFLESDDNFINEDTVENLTVIFNPVFPKRLNIMIFSVEDQRLKSKYDNIYLSQLLSNENFYHIVLIRDKFLYYPLFRKGEMVFTNTSIICKIIRSIVLSNLTGEIQEQKGYKLNALISLIQGLLDRYKIISQYVIINKNKVNIAVGLCLQNIKNKKKFIIPINPSPSTNLPLLYDYVYGDYKTVKQFLKDSGIFTTYKLLINSKSQIIGFLIESAGNREVLINPIKYQKNKMGSKKLAFKYDLESLKYGKRDLNYDLTKQPYMNQLHKVIELELNNKLFTERNKEIRQSIKSKILSNIDKDVSNIMSKIYSQFNTLGTEDLGRIKQIINLAKYQLKYNQKLDPSIVIKDLFKVTTFNYDLDTVRKLRALIKEYRLEGDPKVEKKIIDILDRNLKKIIKIGRPKFDDHSNIKLDQSLIDLCLAKTKTKCQRTKVVGRQQCYWNTDTGNCDVMMDRENYVYHLLRLKDELIYNEAKQVDLLDIRLDTLVEHFK